MDDRLVKKSDSSRDAKEERVSAEGTLATTSERRKMFREFTQEALPTPPAMPGYHFCWLSTTNQYDPIYKRMRMGYEPVTPNMSEALKEFTHLRAKSGEYEGYITVNEMVLFRIPQEIYQEIMEEYHHNMPLEEEERIKANALTNDRDSNGKQLGHIEGEGIGQMATRVPVPTFN